MGEGSPANYIAEFVGTFMLVFTIGCNVLSGQPVWGAVSIACVLTVMIYALGKSSGANFNPAVSVALGLVKAMGLNTGMEWSEVAIYAVTQILGGLCAGGCYLAMFGPSTAKQLKFDDSNCKFHAGSYYCQPEALLTTPKPGSPPACKCEPVVLTGPYSAGALIKCVGCLVVRKSTQKNSCPAGTKLFSPASSSDWKTFINSARPLRSPNWIVDVTRPQNGCGGCSRYSMNFGEPAQRTWRTADGSPWWLRSTKYTEPSGDYLANCYMDLWHTPVNENGVTFNDNKCSSYSNSYYCQPVKKKGKKK